MILLGLVLAVFMPRARSTAWWFHTRGADPRLRLGFGTKEAVAASLVIVGLTRVDRFGAAEQWREAYIRLRVALVFV